MTGNVKTQAGGNAGSVSETGKKCNKCGQAYSVYAISGEPCNKKDCGGVVQ